MFHIHTLFFIIRFLYATLTRFHCFLSLALSLIRFWICLSSTVIIIYIHSYYWYVLNLILVGHSFLFFAVSTRYFWSFITALNCASIFKYFLIKFSYSSFNSLGYCTPNSIPVKIKFSSSLSHPRISLYLEVLLFVFQFVIF